MEAIAEFPFVGELPAASADESSGDRRQRLQVKLKMLRTMIESDGQLVPVALVAECFGLSKQRVHGIVEQGHLRKVDIHGTSYITENSLIEYLNSERRNGRPPRTPSIPQMAKAAAKFGRQT